jgi:hypothetical protein
MSLSFWLMRVSPEIVSINDINEENILALGTKLEILSELSKFGAEISVDDGCCYLPKSSVENSSSFCWKLCLGDDEPIKMIHISPHIGKCNLKIIEDICEQLKCRIFDPQHDQFIN